MNCILVPTLALDLSLLHRLANSIDYPVKNKVIINNGRPHALDKWSIAHPDWKILNFGQNIGVAASWNMAFNQFNVFPDEDAVLICNDDFWFGEGQLEKICKASDEHNKHYPIIYLNDTHPYYCFIWTKRGFNDVGLFDENYFPSYYEDTDYMLRITILEYDFHVIGFKDEEINHGKPQTGGERYRKLLDEVDVYNKQYFINKWGELTDYPTSKTFKTPYNLEGKEISFWAHHDVHLNNVGRLWQQFISEPNASIYT